MDIIILFAISCHIDPQQESPCSGEEWDARCDYHQGHIPAKLSLDQTYDHSSHWDNYHCCENKNPDVGFFSTGNIISTGAVEYYPYSPYDNCNASANVSKRVAAPQQNTNTQMRNQKCLMLSNQSSSSLKVVMECMTQGMRKLHQPLQQRRSSSDKSRTVMKRIETSSHKKGWGKREK